VEGETPSKEVYFNTYNEEDIADEAGTSVFRYVDRVRMINSIVRDAIDLSILHKHGFVVTEYPLHRHKDLEFLKTNWSSLRNIFKSQDLPLLRRYFGEWIAMYFAWLQMYVIWLFFPGIIGLLFYIIINATGDIADTEPEMSVSEGCILVFTMLLCIGSTLFDQLWIRREKSLAWQWGMVNIEAEEH
jgi:hypothetical protein